MVIHLNWGFLDLLRQWEINFQIFGAVLAKSKAKVESHLNLSGDPLCKVRHDDWERLRVIFLNAKLAKAVVQTPCENVAVLINQHRYFFSHADLHDSFIGPEFLGFEQMVGWVKSSSPHKESSILCNCCRVAPSLDILDQHVFQPVYFQWNIG